MKINKVKRKLHVDKKDFFNIPNILCYARIILVPLFMYFYLSGFFYEGGQNLIRLWIAIGLIVLASLTDYVDGQIARRCNMMTDLGKFLDPLADKFMQLAVVIVVAIQFQAMTSEPYIWILLALFLLKEFSQFIAIIALFKHGKYMNGSKWFGKISTFGFDVVMTCLLLFPLFNFYNITISTIMVVCSGVLLLFSWVMYLIEVIKMWSSPGGDIPTSLYKKEEGKDEK
jgi:cardiolipin synthase